MLVALAVACTSATAPARAQPPDSTAAARSFTDSVAVRTPAPGALRAYRDDPAFQYDQARAGTSWWARLRHWLWKTFFAPAAGPLGRWYRPLLYVLLGAALVFAFVQFARMRSGGAWKPAPRSMTASFEEVEANLHEVDLGALVEAAARAGDYRRAVRLSYLHVLRALSGAGRIVWDPARTNRAYVRELAARELAAGERAAAEGAEAASEELAALTRLYERVWYGHADVTAEAFGRLRPRFDRFRRRVEEGERGKGSEEERVRARG